MAPAGERTGGGDVSGDAAHPVLRRTRQSPASARRLAAAAIAAIIIVFTFLAVVDLGRVRPVGGDEVIILGITERWLADGRMGSPMYEGFHGAGDHSFFALVGHNIVQAPFVALLGANIVAARVPSVLAAIGLLIIVATLAWRWFGPGVAVLATALLAFWRTGLVDMDYGFALLTLARQGRYDITATLWMLCAVLFADTMRRRDRQAPLWAAGAGLAAGMATITQFYGIASLAVLIPAAWFSMGRRRMPLLVAGLLAWSCVVAPYGAWVLRHADDARAQFTHAHAARIDAADGPGGAVWNVVREPVRLRGATRLRGAGGMLFLLGSAAAVGWLTVLARRRHEGARMLLVAVAAPLLVLAPLDATKAPVYAFPLLPPLCIAVAAACAAVLPRTSSAGGGRRRALRAAVALGLLLVFTEGAVGLVHDRRVAVRMTSYDELTAELSRSLPDQAVPTGAVRWYLGLHDRGYVTFHALRLRWEQADAAAPGGVPFGEFLDRAGVTHVLLDDEMRADLERAAPAVREEIRGRMEACGPATASWHDGTYGPLAWRRIAGCPD